MTDQFKSFMNSLWNCGDVVVPGLGTIVSTRAKYGTDIEAMLLDNGTIRLIDGTELFDQFPNLFEEKG
tara:strand:+ start:337 stop:540 length:204 start_codon:yes stop_codon:yes gene_type:complete